MVWSVNLWAVLVATGFYFILGAIWYGVFGAAWMDALGKTRDEVAAGAMASPYVVTFVLEAIAVLTLAFVLGNTAIAGLVPGALLGAIVGLGIWLTLMSVTFLYEGRGRALYLVDGGYHLVALTVAGGILGAWG